MVVLSFAYPYGHILDSRYYIEQHMPKVKEVLASFADSRAEVRKDVTPNEGPYQLTLSLYFNSEVSMVQFLADPRIPDLQRDIANFYEGAPHILTEEQIEA